MLQRDPHAPDEAVERLVFGGPDMGMEPKQEEHECAVALAKALETAVAKGLSVGGEVRLREIFHRHWEPARDLASALGACARSWIGLGTRFGAAFVVTRLLVSSC